MWWKNVRPYSYSYERYLEKKRQREIDRLLEDAGYDDSPSANKLYDKILKRLGGSVEYFVLYKKPFTTDSGKEIVACVVNGYKEVRLTREVFESIGGRLKDAAEEFIYGKEEYNRMREREEYEFRERNYSRINKAPVRCISCHRVIPPGYAEHDGAGWSCKDGCEAYSLAFLEQKLREWNGG